MTNESPTLSAEHLAQLREGAGISDEAIAARGYKTIEKQTELQSYGFSPQQCRTAPGLLLPLRATDGGNGLYVFKPDNPPVTHNKKGEPKIRKYLIPKDAGVRVDCPPICQPLLANPDVRLWITEGQKKADALASKGLCAIDLLGVYGFKGRNEFDGVTWLADWQLIALKNASTGEGRDVAIVFDSDVMANPNVQKALNLLTTILQHKGAHVAQVYLPVEAGQKVGVDDYLLRHSVEDLEALIAAPRPTPKAAPAQIELLEDAPLTITRPLALLNGRAVAAIWPYVKETLREGVNKAGEIVRYNPPIENVEQRLMLVRGDGAIFGDGSRELDEIGALVRLREIPPQEKLWSTRGVKRFLAGERPEPKTVFDQICDVIDRFIDFDRSLTNQRGMCEFVACYILASWFLDAFNVIGYVWPNGERGSGKTQLLIILSELGYLGHCIQMGGSFAALRDLADYGALLCFDDCEDLSDPKKTDPEKRTHLLAGNRRGNTIPIKEQKPDGTWATQE